MSGWHAGITIAGRGKHAAGIEKGERLRVRAEA